MTRKVNTPMIKTKTTDIVRAAYQLGLRRGCSYDCNRISESEVRDRHQRADLRLLRQIQKATETLKGLRQ